MRYRLHLEDQRKLTAESEKARKRKAVQDKIRSVEYKKVIKRKHSIYEPRGRCISRVS